MTFKTARRTTNAVMFAVTAYALGVSFIAGDLSREAGLTIALVMLMIASTMDSFIANHERRLEQIELAHKILDAVARGDIAMGAQDQIVLNMALRDDFWTELDEHRFRVLAHIARRTEGVVP